MSVFKCVLKYKFTFSKFNFSFCRFEKLETIKNLQLLLAVCLTKRSDISVK